MKQIIIIISFLTVFQECNCQSDSKTYISLGLNFPAFLGRTLELKGIYARNAWYSWTITSGIMFNNQYAAKWGNPYDGTSNHINSGIYMSLGNRFTPRRSLMNNYLFIGGKFISGYFKQSANYNSQFANFSNDFYFIGDRMYSEGFYLGVAGEIGYAFLIKRKLNIEIGFEYGQELFTTHRTISRFYSRLPGLGIIHTKGLLTVYYRFG